MWHKMWMDRKDGSLDPKMNVQVDHRHWKRLEPSTLEKTKKRLKRKFKKTFKSRPQKNKLVLVLTHHLHAFPPTLFVPQTHSIACIQSLLRRLAKGSLQQDKPNNSTHPLEKQSSLICILCLSSYFSTSQTSHLCPTHSVHTLHWHSSTQTWR